MACKPDQIGPDRDRQRLSRPCSDKHRVTDVCVCLRSAFGPGCPSVPQHLIQSHALELSGVNGR